MKIRFEIELPEKEIHEDPYEFYWGSKSDETIEEILGDAALCDLEWLAKVKINQDDLKEFIKQVREHSHASDR